MSKSKNKITIQSYVSWAAAIIILALGAKILHYEWAEYLIIVGFALEFIVFVVLGFTTKSESKIKNSGIDGELIERLEKSLSIVAKTVENNSKITAALLNEVGAQTIAQALERSSEVSHLDVSALQSKIDLTGKNFDNLNQTLIALAQKNQNIVDAFNSK